MSERGNTDLIPARRGAVSRISVANPLITRGLATLSANLSHKSNPKPPLDINQIESLIGICIRQPINKDDCNEVIKIYTEAIQEIEVCPHIPHPCPYLVVWAYIIRGHAWREKMDYERAHNDYNAAIRLRPDFDLAFVFRGRNWLSKNEYHQAIKDFEEAARINPQQLQLAELAWLLATCPDEVIRDGERAVRLATIACDPRHCASGQELNALAAAYAETGDFAKAVYFQTKALEDPDYEGPDGDVFRQCLVLYKQRKPFRLQL